MAADTVAALAVGDRRYLEASVEGLERLRDAGLVYSLNHPISIGRLLGDVLTAVGRLADACEAFASTVPRLREGGAYLELAMALTSWAKAEARRAGGSGDEARRLAAEAVDLAERLGRGDIAAQAAAVARRTIDRQSSVASRNGNWRVILLTDVVGSTAVSSQSGDLAYHRLVSDHHELVRSCLDQYGGTEFSETGDGLYAWFDSSEDAVAAAFAIQDEITVRDPTRSPLAVKIALAGGEPLFHNGRPFGLVLNRAARLVNVAGSGEVVADEAVSESLPTDAPRRACGQVHLRGIGVHRPVVLLSPSIGAVPKTAVSAGGTSASP
jgi:class 3 adenylate cyclase